MQELYQLEAWSPGQTGSETWANIPSRCLVHATAGFDAELLRNLRESHFRIIGVLRHPLDDLADHRSFVGDVSPPPPASPAFEWSCVEGVLTLHHEECVAELSKTLTQLRRFLGSFDASLAAEAIKRRFDPNIGHDVYEWMGKIPAATAREIYLRHAGWFAALGYPEPASPESAHTSAAGEGVRRALAALDDLQQQREHDEAIVRESKQRRQRLRLRFAHGELSATKSELKNLRRLVYASSAGKHLYRAWQVLLGNAHYRRDEPAVAQDALKPLPPEDPAHINSYEDLHINGLHLKFHAASLADLRGTGRVARDLLATFRTLSSAPTYANAGAAPIHFFTSPHWGPDTLPPRSCVLIHDTIPLELPDYPEQQARRFETRTRHVLGQVEKIFTISQTSARDITRRFGVPPENIVIIPNGAASLPVAASRPANLPDAPYLAYVGGGDDHKNLEILFDALRLPAAAGIHLVMVGENEIQRARVAEFSSRDRIHFAGRLSDADVGAVVQGARGLVFPSYHEGFGLPPFEAALLGIPSICSRRPAMTEFLADATLFADPDSPVEWARRIHALVHRPALAKSLAKAARSRAKTFTWAAAAQSYLREFARMT